MPCDGLDALKDGGLLLDLAALAMMRDQPEIKMPINFHVLSDFMTYVQPEMSFCPALRLHDVRQT